MPTDIQRLIYAIRTGNYPRFDELIRRGAILFAKSPAGRTALHAAAEEGDEKFVHALIAAGADINARTNDGNTPLHFAAAYGGACELLDPDLDRRNPLRPRRQRPNLEVAQIILEIAREKEPVLLEDLELEQKLSEEMKPNAFFEVLNFFSDSERIYAEIKARGCDIDRLDPRMAEVLLGNPRFLKVAALLIKHGADVRALNQQGDTPLRGAVEFGKPEMVELLFQHGAVIGAEKSRQSSADLLDLALKRSKTGIADVLLKNGALLTEESRDLLFEAATNGRVESLRWLCDHGLDIDSRNDRGQTPLIAAGSHYKVFPELLARGADITARDHSGMTALHTAAGWPNSLKLLLERHVALEEMDERGRTPLFHAAQFGDPVPIKLLLQAGARPSAQDRDGNTPLHIIFESEEFRPDIEFAAFHVLVAGGADRSLKNREGQTAFDLAVKHRYPDEFLKLLDPSPALDPSAFIWLGDAAYKDFLPNATISFEVDGVRWPSSEHYFQAQKVPEAADRENIRQAPDISAAHCRMRESKGKIPDDWTQRCDNVMRRALLAKFQFDADLRRRLLETGDAYLVSDSNTDDYWMEASFTGFNAIGKILMDIRASLGSRQ